MPKIEIQVTMSSSSISKTIEIQETDNARNIEDAITETVGELLFANAEIKRVWVP